MVTVLESQRSAAEIKPDSAKSFRAISTSILVRLQQQDPTNEDMRQLAELFTEWWRVVVAMEIPWEEKEKAAKAVVYFRRSYRQLPLSTARELRFRSQRILTMAGAAVLSGGTPDNTASSPEPVTIRPANRIRRNRARNGRAHVAGSKA